MNPTSSQTSRADSCHPPLRTAHPRYQPICGNQYYDRPSGLRTYIRTCTANGRGVSIHILNGDGNLRLIDSGPGVKLETPQFFNTKQFEPRAESVFIRQLDQTLSTLPPWNYSGSDLRTLSMSEAAQEDRIKIDLPNMDHFAVSEDSALLIRSLRYYCEVAASLCISVEAFYFREAFLTVLDQLKVEQARFKERTANPQTSCAEPDFEPYTTPVHLVDFKDFSALLRTSISDRRIPQALRETPDDLHRWALRELSSLRSTDYGHRAPSIRSGFYTKAAEEIDMPAL